MVMAPIVLTPHGAPSTHVCLSPCPTQDGEHTTNVVTVPPFTRPVPHGAPFTPAPLSPCPTQDGDNTNNIITVLPRVGDDLAARERILSPQGHITEEEREELAAMLCPWASHDKAMHRPRGSAERSL